IVLIELGDDGFQQTYSDDDSLSLVDENQEVYAVETPEFKPATQSEGEYILLLWVNRIGTGTQGRMFGSPYVVQISREATFKEIQKQMLVAMDDILQNDVSLENIGIVLRLRVIGGLSGKCYLPSDVDHPLYMPTVDHALEALEATTLTGPQHLKLIVEWDQETKEEMISDVEVLMEVDPSVQKLRNQQKQVPKVTLDECFQHYFVEEKLGEDNAWMCPSCRQHQLGVKQLSLWSCPDYFIIHLKRFRQSSSQRTKLKSLVEFPVSGLDMAPYVAQRNPILINSHPNGMWTWSPWKRPRTQNFTYPEENVYELYAVCNHHGNMQAGHYTGKLNDEFFNGVSGIFDYSNGVSGIFDYSNGVSGIFDYSNGVSGIFDYSNGVSGIFDYSNGVSGIFDYSNGVSESSFDTINLRHKGPFQRGERRFASMIPLTPPKKDLLVDRHSGDEAPKEEVGKSDLDEKSDKGASPGQTVFRVTAV
ncbi:ubiquitin carboxyl-terminal hydrolase 43-like, partial [Limulus polyphemus]|uniref:ubiquitinyl hydrolase 1 n=1 Tax=Limulus polyphemus TaxID=6850 RepID=A0ABM1TS75_LIMPO